MLAALLSRATAFGAMLYAMAGAARRASAAHARPYLPVLGLACLLSGTYLLMEEIRFVAVATQAPGIVEGNDASGSGSTALYHAVVQFEGPGGVRWWTRDRLGTSPAWYRAGDRVFVLYPTGNPSQAVIDRGLWKWFPAIGLILAGGLVFGLSLFRLIATWQARRFALSLGSEARAPA